jgi:pSer/pThr/pTyr-binding forkhead associated (FHA) protein
MAARIQYLFGRRYGAVELGDDPIVIGQARDCSIREKDKLLARRHARIHRENDRYWVTDLGSETGTWINGERIDAPRALVNRDRIKCGSLDLEFFE